MVGMEPVQERFDGIECGARNFHKQSDPIGHAAIPEPWPFQSLEVTALIGFMRNEAGIGVTERHEIKGLSLIIPHATDDIDRVKVRG